MHFVFHRREESFWHSPVFEKLKVVFWVGFALLPLFTGILAYHWLPNESYNPTKHELIESHTDSDGTTVGELADVWVNKASGKVYSRAGFASHREHEEQRLVIVNFLYGFIGCLFFAFSRWLQNEKAFFSALGCAMLFDLAWVAFCYFHHAS